MAVGQKEIDMDEKTLEDVLSEIVGKTCLFSSIDGAYRTEKVDHVASRLFTYGAFSILYPMKVCFDPNETDFMYMHSISSIKIVE